MSHSNLAYALPDDDGQELSGKEYDFSAELQQYQEKAATLIPKDELTIKQCAAFIEECKTAAKRVEEKRQVIVGPLNKQVDEANAVYIPVRDAFKSLAKAVDTKVAVFIAEQKRKAEEEQRRINAEAERRRLELERKAEAERRKAQEAAAQGDAEASAKLEAKAEQIEAKAATVAPTVVETPANTIKLGDSTLSVKAPPKDWILPGWDKTKPLPVLSGSFTPLVGDLAKLPDGLRWLLRFCDVNPVRLNQAFKSGERFPKPFAEIEKFGGSTLRSK